MALLDRDAAALARAAAELGVPGIPVDVADPASVQAAVDAAAAALGGLDAVVNAAGISRGRLSARPRRSCGARSWR